MRTRINNWITVSIFILLTGSQCFAQDAMTDFDRWLKAFRKDAFAAGIRGVTLDKSLSQVQLLSWVIDADRNQPEFKKSLKIYLDGILSQKRIERGRLKLAENRQLLTRIGNKYGVQPRFIVALWGIETYYGKHTGKVPIIDALVTLAYDGRRSKYFRKELLNALKIIDAGHIDYARMKGSWAGAMGQVQFMPSSFLNYAVDGNNDDRIDLWQTPEDYLSSAANYLAKMGWQDKQTWGREVKLPNGFDSGLFNGERLPLSEWQKKGVRRLNGTALPQVDIVATMIQPEGNGRRAFLVYANYDALMKWNRAHSFALAVGMLADELVK